MYNSRRKTELFYRQIMSQRGLRYMLRKIYSDLGIISLCLVFIFSFCDKAKKVNNDFAAISLNKSIRPIRPGIPGKQPFWNINSRRFIYAPAFDFTEITGAKRYRFTATTTIDSLTYIFESSKPWHTLSPIWKQLPNTQIQLKVEAVDNETGESIKTVGTRTFLKSPPFNGIHNEPAYSYNESGYRNLHNLLHQAKIQYWLQHDLPDPGYPLWSHPTKIMSALVIGMIHYAKYFPDANDMDQALNIANTVVNFLLSMREPAGSPLEYWPPTYWDGIPRDEHPYFHQQIMTNTPAIGATMFLDLYDFTSEDKYFIAAKQIADTYAKTQMEIGTWPQIMHTHTGKAVKSNMLIPTMVIELFDRFLEQYQIFDYAESRRKAFDWCMENPVKTFNWQAQFEDTRPLSQFKNLAREEATELARILFKESKQNPEYIDLAKDLLRFTEDQFIVWQSSDPVLSYPWFSKESKWNGTTLESGCDWFIPCVLEQYKFYTPIARSSQLMILAYLEAFEYTGEKIFHAQAVTIANTLTIAQQYHGGGEIPTHLRKNLPEDNWINNGVYPSITLIQYDSVLNKYQMICK
jgi:hypothetical protein